MPECKAALDCKCCMWLLLAVNGKGLKVNLHRVCIGCGIVCTGCINKLVSFSGRCMFMEVVGQESRKQCCTEMQPARLQMCIFSMQMFLKVSTLHAARQSKRPN